MLLCFYASKLLCYYASMLLCCYASMLLCFYASMHQLQISPLNFHFELELQATITIYNSTSTSNSDFKPQLRLSLAQLSPSLYHVFLVYLSRGRRRSKISYLFPRYTKLRKMVPIENLFVNYGK